MPHVALPGFLSVRRSICSRSFAGSVFRATIHSGVRHWFVWCCAERPHTLPKSVKPITRTRTYLCGNCAARRATAAEPAAVPAETTTLCYPWLVKAYERAGVRRPAARWRALERPMAGRSWCMMQTANLAEGNDVACRGKLTRRNCGRSGGDARCSVQEPR